MQKTVVKYAIILFLLITYINRGVFITPYEIENHGNKEINSIIEWVQELITGQSNDIDEDGDLQSDCISVNAVNFNYYQEITQYLDLLSLYSKDLEKIPFSNEEKFFLNDFYTQIDHPPES